MRMPASPRSLLRLLGAIALIATAPAARAQTLANTGFESPFDSIAVDPACPAIHGRVANGWYDNSCWAGNTSASIAYAADFTAPHGGASSQRIVTGGPILQLVQTVPFTQGRLYTATVWMRASGPATVSVMLRQLDAPYATYAVRTFELTSTWAPYTVRGLTPTVTGLFMIRSERPATFWVDDASLTWTPFSLAPPSGEIPPQYFGMHFHRPDIPWPSVGQHIRTVRIWDADGAAGQTGAQWAAIHTGPGVFDWRSLDDHVARARAQGADIVFNLGRCPQWASARPNEPSPYGPGQAAEPADLQTWRDWVSAAGTRYAGRIRYWEIWNEPNDASFYTGTPATLVTLAREAHQILKALDPQNQLVSPSPYALDYLHTYLSLGGGDWADIIGYHFYIIGNEPEVLSESYIPGARVVLETYGQQNKPLWDTEAGWFAPPALPDDLGAAYVARSYLLNWAAGVARFQYYAWDQVDAGIHLSLPPTFDAPTPAAVAYGEVSRWMVRARMTGLSQDPQGVWIAAFVRPDSSRAWAVWHPGHTAAQPLTFAIPPEWDAQWRRDLAGGITPISGGTTPVERRPILLESVRGVSAERPDATGDALFVASSNPARNSTRLVFTLAEPSRVELDVFDEAGRRVARLANEELGAGTHERTWDHVGPGGRPVTGGVHFARLRLPGRVWTCKWSVVR